MADRSGLGYPATFSDRRAERIAAEAQADQQRALAEQTRAQTALTMAQVEQARQAGAAALAERRYQREKAERDEARARRSEARARFMRRLPVWLLSVLWATVIVAPVTLAWQAQRQFAESTLHIPSAWSWLFPLAVEAGAWVCAFEAHRRAKTGRPVGALLTWMWVLASIAAGINLMHGATDYSLTAGVALAVMSLLGVLLHQIRQNADRAAAEGRDNTALRRALWRRIRFPRLSWSAASIAAARGEATTADEAWRQAWVDRCGVGPEASRRDRRLARVIVRHQRKADRKAARAGDLTIIGGVILPVTLPGLPVDKPGDGEPAQAAPMAVLPTVEHIPETPIVQAQLSDKAAALLARVRAEIAAGNLPDTPSATAIRKAFGGAYDIAAAVRDVLAQRAGNEAA